jgi:hypothetical protein
LVQPSLARYFDPALVAQERRDAGDENRSGTRLIRSAALFKMLAGGACDRFHKADICLRWRVLSAGYVTVSVTM